MRLDPKDEVKYRIKLAEKYFEKARDSYKRREYRDTVLNSQLSVENSAKAVIACYKTPSWSHNPAPELRDLLEKIPEKFKSDILKLAEMAETLASEHGRATYGEPTLHLTPWEIYTSKEAEKALKYAEKSLEIAHAIISSMPVDDNS